MSELVGLRLEPIDHRACTLHVRNGKGTAARAIELEAKGTRMLNAWLDARPRVANDLFFVSRHGEPLSDRDVQQLLTKYARLIGIRMDVTPHVLRHTFASHKADMETTSL